MLYYTIFHSKNEREGGLTVRQHDGEMHRNVDIKWVAFFFFYPSSIPSCHPLYLLYIARAGLPFLIFSYIQLVAFWLERYPEMWSCDYKCAAVSSLLSLSLVPSSSSWSMDLILAPALRTPFVQLARIQRREEERERGTRVFIFLLNWFISSEAGAYRANR